MAFEIPQIPPLSTIPTKLPSRSGSIKSPLAPASPFDPLSAALSTAQAGYTIANAKSLQAYNEACHDLPGGNTRTVLHSSPFPITFASGRGCELTNLDGDIYVDFLGEFTAGIYGHSNELIATAVSVAMKEGWNFGGPNKYERELARKVTRRFAPSGIELIRFTNSGTESNTMAIAAAVAYTQRKKILVFTNGYHGGTLSFPATLSEINVNLPHDFVLAPYNDIDGTLSVINGLPKDSLAAILVEPIQGSGGCIVGNKSFLQYLNTTAHQNGALFIVDEVMTSRLSYNGFSAELGLKPDLITLGKWVGGGMTFGAFGGRKDGPMAMFDPRDGVLSHSGTFNNNIVTMAAGCAGMEIYNEDQVLRLNALGEGLKAGVGKVLEKYGLATPVKTKTISRESSVDTENDVNFGSLSLAEKTNGPANMWISGQGSMLAIHFSGDNEKSLLAILWHHMLDHGIYMAQRGFMALNLELAEMHVEKFLQTIESFVEKYHQALSS